MLAGTTACATHELPKTVDTACLNFRAISYAQLPPGQTSDPANVADTPETVGEIEVHNAKYRSLCEEQQ